MMFVLYYLQEGMSRGRYNWYKGKWGVVKAAMCLHDPDFKVMGLVVD